MPATFGLPAHVRADLVHLVHEDQPRGGPPEQHVDRRAGAELLARPLEEAAEHGLARPPALRLLAEHVGVDADHRRAGLEHRVGREVGLDGAHQRRLARAGGADHQDVAHPQPRELLGEGHRHLADGLVLAEDAPREGLGDGGRVGGGRWDARGTKIMASRRPV